MSNPVRRPRLFEALIPVIFLTVLISVNVFIFGDDALAGSNQMVLILSAAVAALVAIRMGHRWETLHKGIVKAIGSAMSAILILFLIGSLAGTWLLSGIVPSMIYYGLQVLNPTIFLVAACIVSAIVSLATGSSWSTVATLGVALLGIGRTLGIPEASLEVPSYRGPILGIRCRHYPTLPTWLLPWRAQTFSRTSGIWPGPRFLPFPLPCSSLCSLDCFDHRTES